MYVFPDNGLKIELLTYSASTDSNTQPDPSLIQLSILWKTSISYSKLITLLVIELK